MIKVKQSGVKILILIFYFLIFSGAAQSQTTAFSYQGRLTESGSPVTGTRFFRFTLYDENGAAIPGAAVEQNLTVTNGVFNTSLDFGAGAFPGANRSLQIEVKINAGDAYTVLNPRQNILSVPYSIKSKTADNSNQLGGLSASNFIQQDAGGNVSIGGNLTVNGAANYNTVNAQTQYNLGGSRFITQNVGQSNLAVGFDTGNVNAAGVNYSTFFGISSGKSNNGSNNSFFGATVGFFNTNGSSNSFFGTIAGFSNTNGNNNSFFGAEAGTLTTTGSDNSFFGVEAGKSNVIGNANSFFGRGAGRFNTADQNSFFGNLAGYANSTGDRNAFFGIEAGLNNTTGCCNSFFGNRAGSENTIGRGNTFLGGSAGRTNAEGNQNTFVGDLSGTVNTTGSSNITLGSQANFGSGNLNFAAAVGANSTVNTSDTIVLGKIAGTYNGIVRPADTVQIPGNLNILGNLTGGGIVKAINGLTNNITLAAGANITITPSGNTLTIASSGGGTVNAILNQTTQQAGANFNIGGNGTANIFNATTQYNLGGSRILGVSVSGGNTANNLFVGIGAGQNNPTNFAERNLGVANGSFNTFIGALAGEQNSAGIFNTFVGAEAGRLNNARGNTFVGSTAGTNTKTGGGNSFFGDRSGENNVGGASNSFFGAEAGRNNETGSGNTAVGASADFGANNLTNAAAIGANASVSQSNSLILGSINGVNNATADTSVGIGTTAPKAKLEVTGGNILIGSPGQGIILKSPDGATCRLLSIDNAGAMIVSAVACP